MRERAEEELVFLKYLLLTLKRIFNFDAPELELGSVTRFAVGGVSAFPVRCRKLYGIFLLLFFK